MVKFCIKTFRRVKSNIFSGFSGNLGYKKWWSRNCIQPSSISKVLSITKYLKCFKLLLSSFVLQIYNLLSFSSTKVIKFYHFQYEKLLQNYTDFN